MGLADEGGSGIKIAHEAYYGGIIENHGMDESD